MDGFVIDESRIPSHQSPFLLYSAVRRWKIILGWIAVLALLVALRELWQWRREHRFDAEIEAAAAEHGVDKFLLKALVWRESGFDPNAESRKGALGLTQVLPSTGQDWAKATGRVVFKATDLLQPATNLDAGAWYLARALKYWSPRGNDATALALAEYNAGRNNVGRWMEDPSKASVAVLDRLQFSETRKYVKLVLSRAEKYRQRGKL